LRGEETVCVRFFDGNEQDAFLLALATNVTHGLPLSLADRKAAAARVIRYRPDWSDRAIAEVAGLSHKTVGVIRRRLAGEIPQTDKRIGRDGHLRPAGAEEGRRIAGELLAIRPDASLREIARAAGISPETARDVRTRVREGRDPVLPASRGTTGVCSRVARKKRDSGSPSPDAVLEHLRGDPTLRGSELGRTLLRLLALHASLPRTSDLSALGDAVPEHCRPAVVVAAVECAEAWQALARRLG
jgi:hypothetical protein